MFHRRRCKTETSCGERLMLGQCRRSLAPGVGPASGWSRRSTGFEIALQQHAEMPLVRIGRLEDAVFHPAGHRDLLGEVLLGLHYGIFDLVVGLYLDDHVFQAAIRLFALEDEVWVVAAHGA